VASNVEVTASTCASNRALSPAAAKSAKTSSLFAADNRLPRDCDALPRFVERRKRARMIVRQRCGEYLHSQLRGTRFR
jgi:hypothetical protein